MAKTQAWCRHIRWRSGIASSEWETKINTWSGNRIFTVVPRSWKCCPICFELRPGYKLNTYGKIRKALKVKLIVPIKS